MLLRRDMHVLRQRILGIWFDTMVILCLDIMLFACLIPLMGLPASMIAPIFLGSAIGQMFFKVTARSFDSIRDIHFTKFIEYHLTLPLPKTWLFAQIICSWVIETVAGIAPFIIIGVIALHKFFALSLIGWLKGIPFFILVATIMNMGGFACSYYYEYSWFMHNVWPRRYGLIYTLCPVYFSWEQAHAFSPRVAQLLLINPLTYCVEGFRSAMLGSNQFIAASLCMGALTFFGMISILMLRTGVKKRLDPV
jgi:ABC-type polysaccharide/polyol phosphate export permease